MNVRLYKSWQHGAAMRFDHFGYGVVNLTANFRDASVADQHITALDGIIFIHRHNCAALDENRFGHGMNYRRRLCGVCRISVKELCKREAR